LDREIDLVAIGRPLIKDRYKENLRSAAKGEPKWYMIIMEIDFLGEDVLAMDGLGFLQPIYRFDLDGRLKDVYYVEPRMGLRLNQFCARVEKNGEERFYILWRDVEEGDYRLGVYGRKK
jgi:hypothetical protein